MSSRFLTVKTEIGTSSVEVLESFKFGGVAREFNVRLKYGIAPTDAALVAALRQEFNIPETYAGNCFAMAGDRNVRFNPAPEVTKTDVTDPKEDRTVETLHSDSHGIGAGDDAGVPVQPVPDRVPSTAGFDVAREPAPKPKRGSGTR